jgi:cephalosporin-C deacetylase
MMYGKNNKGLIILCSFLFLFVVVQAQTRVPSIAAIVSLDHSDWKYNSGQNALFTITINNNGKPLKDVIVHIEIGAEKMQAAIVKDSLLKKGRLTINGGTLLQPGFLRCIVTAYVDGKNYRGLATAAFSADSIVATAQMPQDFSKFWKDAITASRKIPIDSRMKLIGERSTGIVNVYEVSFQSYRNGSRIYGILCVPKKEGIYPAVLKLPGAGVRSYKGDTALSEKGIVTFEIGIHGIPVTLSNQVYYDLAFGALNEYYFSNLNDKERYYYKRVYAGCVRAIDFLLTLPRVDSSRVAVYGGSQGGALAIVTAALHERVKYVAALYPAMSDLTGYFHNRAGGWPHMFSPALNGAFRKTAMIETAEYYDLVNFARILHVPGWYSWGYNDEVCPPTSVYAAYNTITAPKELFITKDTGHWLSTPQSEESTKWLLRMLNVEQ